MENTPVPPSSSVENASTCITRAVLLRRIGFACLLFTLLLLLLWSPVPDEQETAPLTPPKVEHFPLPLLEEARKQADEEKRLAAQKLADEEKARKEAVAQKLREAEEAKRRVEEAKRKIEEERRREQARILARAEELRRQRLDAERRAREAEGVAGSTASTMSVSTEGTSVGTTSVDSTDGEQASTASVAKEIPWSEREITAPVPRANIVIYVKHRMLMLRSYDKIVRVYRNISVPHDTSAPKQAANEERSPIGDYYLCGREDTEAGKRMAISYPSSSDAEKALKEKRISEEEKQAIDAASRSRTRPPWTTTLGGYVYLRSSSDPEEYTSDGFVLYPEQLEELWVAAPDGTPVLIR